MDQIELFNPDQIALLAITHDFEEMYPGTPYKITFERNLCE